MVPAVGQGAIGIEIRDDDPRMVSVCHELTDDVTLACVRAERVVMRGLEGGCQVPIGAYARIEDGTMVMDAMVGSLDGVTIVRDRLTGSVEDPDALGQAMVARLTELGAVEILKEIVRE